MINSEPLSGNVPKALCPFRKEEAQVRIPMTSEVFIVNTTQEGTRART